MADAPDAPAPIVTRKRLRGMLSAVRHGLPDMLGRVMPPLDADRAVAIARRQAASTIGCFQGDAADPDSIVAAYRTVAGRGRGLDVILSIKAPPLDFHADRMRVLAREGLPLMFDAHGPGDADRTIALVEALLPDFPGTGCVLPARWRRSMADAARLRDTTARIRIVKGEWPDPDGATHDTDADYRALAAALAGRAAPVGIATHRPALARQAIALLNAAGTPCELEQLRGLPGRRCRGVAKAAGIPVRLYIPFGPGWVPYAVEQALSRPYLPRLMIRDWLGRADT